MRLILVMFIEGILLTLTYFINKTMKRTGFRVFISKIYRIHQFYAR